MLLLTDVEGITPRWDSHRVLQDVVDSTHCIHSPSAYQHRDSLRVQVRLTVRRRNQLAQRKSPYLIAEISDKPGHHPSLSYGIDCRLFVCLFTFHLPIQSHSRPASMPAQRQPPEWTPAQLVSAFLKQVEHAIIPLTAIGVASGNKLFGAAILRKDDLSLVIAATNQETNSPLLVRVPPRHRLHLNIDRCLHCSTAR